ncbi:distal membrane-arm assembly complex protein 2 isoform 2-T2 [Mantella aurantiaca]
MAASSMLRTLCLRPFSGYVFARLSSSSSFSAAKKKVPEFFWKFFSDIDTFTMWKNKITQWKVDKMNSRFTYMESVHGKSVSVAYYTLVHKGRVRFQGHQDWLSVANGRISFDLMKYKDLPIECVDLSNSEVNYFGLDPILEVEDLRYLNLSCCRYIDDWCLSRLHVLGHSLESLVLAGCPKITERGLACLHNLQNLKHLDISDLPNVSHKGLTKILLEEVMPNCEIVGVEYSDGLQGESGTPPQIK